MPSPESPLGPLTVHADHQQTWIADRDGAPLTDEQMRSVVAHWNLWHATKVATKVGYLELEYPDDA